MSSRLRYLSVLFLLLSAFSPLSIAFADGGSIPFEPDVKIFEPEQRGLITWNGEEQILLLQTDLRASKATKVLEVFPFPAEPEVVEGDTATFQRAVELINKHNRSERFDEGSYGEEAGGYGDAAPPPAARVSFHEKIGAHDIAVIQVLRKEGFIEWVKKYLASRNVRNPVIPRPLEDVVEEYIDDGFTWFAFDVVSLTTKPVSKQAIQFKFKTNCMYYPLRITRAESGYTTVSLLVLTTELFKLAEGMAFGISHYRLRLLHEPVTLSSAELRYLSRESAELLGHPSSAKLRIWEFRGELSKFQEDVVVCAPSWKLHRGRNTERDKK